MPNNTSPIKQVEASSDNLAGPTWFTPRELQRRYKISRGKCAALIRMVETSSATSILRLGSRCTRVDLGAFEQALRQLTAEGQGNAQVVQER